MCNTFIPSGFVTNVDQLWHDFKSAFVSVADRHAPIIQRRVRGIDNCPWLNKEIKSVMRQRDYFHSKARLMIPRTGLVIVAIEIVCRTL